MAKQIPINTINPSGSDGTYLSGYFFKAEESGLNLYAPAQGNQAPQLVQENITLGTQFQFTIPAKGNNPPNPVNMKVTINSYSLVVSGSWSDLAGPSLTGDPGSGTFQAQAGGSTADGEDAASSATA